MWNTIIITPLYNILHFFFLYFKDIGFAIIFLTIFIKILLFPLNISSSRTAKGIKKIQPEIEKLKEKYKNNPRELAINLSALYKENKIKPFSGIFNLLIQIPILIGLYQIIIKEIDLIEDKITFFNIDITQTNYILAVLSFITLYILMVLSLKETNQNLNEMKDGFQKEFTKILNIQMKYFLPIITLIISLFLPAGVVLYFIVSNLFGIGQLFLIKKILEKY